MKFILLLSLLFMTINGYAIEEDFSNNNSNITNAQFIGNLTLSSKINVFGARGTINTFGTTITDDHDADFYSFYADAGLGISINVLSSFGPEQINDPYLGFFNATTGIQLASNDNGGTGYDSFLAYDIIDTGSYVFAVTGHGDTDFNGSAVNSNFLYAVEVSSVALTPDDVSSVPVPAAAWLFGGALFSIIISIKRRII